MGAAAPKPPLAIHPELRYAQEVSISLRRASWLFPEIGGIPGKVASEKLRLRIVIVWIGVTTPTNHLTQFKGFLQHKMEFT